MTIKPGDEVRFAELPKWVDSMAEESRRVFAFCLGKVYRVSEIDSNRLVVLDVHEDVDPLFGGFQNDIRLEARYLERVAPRESSSMEQRKSPQEKKRLSLERDHPLQAKYPHGFRGSWPRKKRQAEQAFRHKTKQTLSLGKGAVHTELEEIVDVGGLKRKTVRKWGSESLGTVIQKKKARRIKSYRRKKNAKLERGDA